MAIDPYSGLTTAQRAMTPRARLDSEIYAFKDYDAALNEGMYADGHRKLWSAMVADSVAVHGDVAAIAAMLSTLLAGEGGWIAFDPSRPVARVDASTLAIDDIPEGGDCSSLMVAGRAISLLQGVASGFGYVVSAEYDAPNTRTLVTVEDIAVDAGITEVRLGQDPRNAPKTSPGVSPWALEFYF